ncbi:MAG: T9SS type A sorting domain-containing protein [Chlorobi bacterium]|nr:T9SS type A sorting domain-containing protein [Chlorobiota bacterium]
MKLIAVIAIQVFFFSQLFSQIITEHNDKCGKLDLNFEKERLSLLGSGWGYNYDSLLNDLTRWRSSPYVKIDSIGRSVKGRTIWQLTITSKSDNLKKIAFIHSRTHPNEVQANHVANQIIEQLISEKDYSKAFRENAILYIIPQYHPHGVELGKPRENANDIDLEREWDKSPMQIEAASLKNRFMQIMSTNNPIRIALNLHSAYTCKRYFVFHDPTGTSIEYSELEKKFVTGVKSFFSNGIEPWDFNITWVGTPSTLFPESWWWFNYNKNVIALTYEDMNCDANGKYDSTAFAIIGGIWKYLGIPRTLSVNANEKLNLNLNQNYPNPSRVKTTIDFSILQNDNIKLIVSDLLGNELIKLVDGKYLSGKYSIDLDLHSLPQGNYLYSLKTSDKILTKILTVY